MHQLNSIFYPRPDYDFPIFLFLTVVTKSNVIAIFNVNCPFKDAAYTATYVDPLTPILESYPPFSGRDRYPDWFEKYRTPATIFGVFGKDQLEPLTECGLAFLETYLRRAVVATKVEDPDRCHVSVKMLRSSSPRSRQVARAASSILLSPFVGESAGQ